MQTLLEWAAIWFGALSACLWAWAAFKRVPRLSVPWNGSFKDDHPWVVATESTAKIARWASGITALAVTCQTLVAVLGKFSS